MDMVLSLIATTASSSMISSASASAAFAASTPLAPLKDGPFGRPLRRTSHAAVLVSRMDCAGDVTDVPAAAAAAALAGSASAPVAGAVGLGADAARRILARASSISSSYSGLAKGMKRTCATGAPHSADMIG